MSAIVAEFDVSGLSRPRPITEEVLVGKDVLELVAGAMYADPLTIYREYIQNAADAIDLMRTADPSSGPLGVTITLDRATRTVLIRDTGASIPAPDFIKRLTSLGASTKRGKALRGFRGVGRLSGLGYCQELIFRGRAQGDAKVTELRWDGRKLRELLRDASYSGNVGGLVQSVVEVRKLPGEEFPERFFEVELRKVVRLRGDLLLNDERIRAYLAQVAPVPFHPGFALGKKIATFLQERGVQPPIEVRLAGDEAPIYHPVQNAIFFGEKHIDPIRSVELIELRGQDGDVEAFGWILEHGYLGAVPRRQGFGGLRLRAGNVQVGSESVLAGLFAEPRFCGWAVGEIHVESPRILPNARRDEFEASVAYAYIQDELSIVLKRISQTIRDQSISRNRVRKAQALLAVADQWLDQARDEDLAPAVAATVRKIVEERIEEAHKQLEKMPEDGEEAATLRQRIKTALARRTRLLREEPARSGARRSPKEKAIAVALSVILEHAASPHAGLTMSKRVLSALEAS